MVGADGHRDGQPVDGRAHVERHDMMRLAPAAALALDLGGAARA